MSRCLMMLGWSRYSGFKRKSCICSFAFSGPLRWTKTVSIFDTSTALRVLPALAWRSCFGASLTPSPFCLPATRRLGCGTCFGLLSGGSAGTGWSVMVAPAPVTSAFGTTAASAPVSTTWWGSGASSGCGGLGATPGAGAAGFLCFMRRRSPAPLRSTAWRELLAAVMPKPHAMTKICMQYHGLDSAPTVPGPTSKIPRMSIGSARSQRPRVKRLAQLKT
mmetsp:Transcript_19309/g.44917  ORF Transcript_19309/g.44917 Transcript_19309/m.44917 type:complete len:220 (+) Transcript_19309:815-1474(+)